MTKIIFYELKDLFLKNEYSIRVNKSLKETIQ